MSEKNKPSEEQLQQWLDAVHFSSCCSDPVNNDNSSKKDNIEFKKPSTDKS